MESQPQIPNSGIILTGYANDDIITGVMVNKYLSAEDHF